MPNVEQKCPCQQCANPGCQCGGKATPAAGECCCGPTCQCGEACKCPPSCNCPATRKS
jgi:hypothetical protein